MNYNAKILADYMDRNRLMLKIYWVFAACVAFIEVCDFLYFYFILTLDIPVLEYAVRYFIVPTGASVLLGLILSAVTVYLGRRRPVAVAYVSMFTLVICVSVLVIVHYSVSVVFLAFALPVILSLFYSDRRITLVYSALSLVAYLSVVIFYLPTRPAGTYKHNFTDALTTVSIMIFLIVISMKIISSHRELTAQLIEQTVAQITLERRVKEDPLTKLYNHAVFYDSLDMAIMSFKDSNACFCLSVLDIDNFKVVNDRYGHLFGDQVILRLVDAIRAYTNENDMAFRYGGEEFAVISFRTLDETVAMNESIREAFAGSPYEDYPGVRCTVSVGVSLYSRSFTGKREFFASADAALFRAKRAGKNRVAVAGPEDYEEKA